MIGRLRFNALSLAGASVDPSGEGALVGTDLLAHFGIDCEPFWARRRVEKLITLLLQHGIFAFRPVRPFLAMILEIPVFWEHVTYRYTSQIPIPYYLFFS